nr:MAG TPA: hypothetical protein [Bacteriophage sp.]
MILIGLLKQEILLRLKVSIVLPYLIANDGVNFGQKNINAVLMV